MKSLKMTKNMFFIFVFMLASMGFGAITFSTNACVIGVNCGGGGGGSYTITFSETGLPSGTTWHLTYSFNNQQPTTISLTSTSKSFTESYGTTFSYSVSSEVTYNLLGYAINYSPSPSSGSGSISNNIGIFITYFVLAQGWSGYAVTNLYGTWSSPYGTVSFASGNWIVPQIQGSCPTSINTSSVFWVGIGGVMESNVEQTGTASNCINGRPTYYAWWGMGGYKIGSITISPGDNIYASDTYENNNSYDLYIKDLTTNQFYHHLENIALGDRYSAEWIAEAPSIGNTFEPLSDFGTVSFSNCYATINGTSGYVNNFPTSSDQYLLHIKMVDSIGNLKDTISTLSGYGDFTASWLEQGP